MKRMNPVGLAISFLFICSMLQAQEERANYLLEIEAVETCIQSNEVACEYSYRQAIDLALATKNDSTIGDAYLKVCFSQKKMGLGLPERQAMLQEGLNYLEDKNQACFEGMLLSESGNLLYESGDEDFVRFQDSAMIMGKTCQTPFYQIQMRIGKATSLQFTGKIAKAILVYQEAEKLARESNDSLSLAQIKIGFANMYNSNKDFEFARENYFEGSQIALGLGDTTRYWYGMINYCHVSVTTDHTDVAKLYLPPAIEHFKKIGYTGVLPYAFSQLGRAYIIEKQGEEAIPFLMESEGLCQELGMATQRAYNDLLLAKAHHLSGNLPNALDYAKKAYNASKDHGIPGDLMDASKYLSELLKENGDFEASILQYEEYMSLKDSLFNERKMKEISELQTELQVEQKENEICAQESEISLLESENKAAQTRNIMLLVALLCLGAVGYALFARQKLKSTKQQARLKQKELENEKLNQEMAFKNRELSAKALNIAQKNELLQKLQKDLEEMANEQGAQACVREVVNTLRLESTIDGNWDQFTQQFAEVNPSFYKNLTEAGESIGKGDLRLAALLRMNLSSKEIAGMLNISDAGVKKARQRFRKKLNLSSEESLEAFIMTL